MDKDLYSKFVRWLSVILPLVALCLISTIFLFSKTNNAVIEQNAKNTSTETPKTSEAIRRSVFRGSNKAYHSIDIIAQTIERRSEANDLIEIHDLIAEVITIEHEEMVLAGPVGLWNDVAKSILFLGGASFSSNSGYDLTFIKLSANFRDATVLEGDMVQGHLPTGTISARKMRGKLETLDRRDELHFIGDVQLLYTPGAVRK